MRVRTNLVALSRSEAADLPALFASNGVALLASLPGTSAEAIASAARPRRIRPVDNRTAQLDALGYGAGDGLTLDVAYNPPLGELAQPESILAEQFRAALEPHGVRFDSLYAIANVPAGRYRRRLRAEDGLDSYLSKLRGGVQPRGRASARMPPWPGHRVGRHALRLRLQSRCRYRTGRGTAHTRRPARRVENWRRGAARDSYDATYLLRSTLLCLHRRGGFELKRPALVTRSGRGNRICIITRFSRLGKVKTRLTPPLSAEEALALHDRMVRHTLRRALAVAATGEARVEVRTDITLPRAAHDWLGRGFSSRYQGEGDLGDRIRLAFSEAFARGEKRVVVIGSDCPRLTSDHLRDAIRRLSHIDVVLGPAKDGGYYLVALRAESAKRSVPALFTEIPWSSPGVLAATLAIAEKNDLTYALLERFPTSTCRRTLRTHPPRWRRRSCPPSRPSLSSFRLSTMPNSSPSPSPALVAPVPPR